ncbi:hypothetical protein POTOM_028885 [Populus tomentosa]|uniref:E3 ubiquitin-protein ligase RING1a n=1 Tax=Populus tomentosa TaxID=118781 RepID=A0A8X7ZK47_POPTO|nr:hypothetical protein POTOM_028885 [Populus tomentosa]
MPAHTSVSSPDNINPDNEQQQGEEQEQERDQEHHQQQQRQDLSELSPPLQNWHPTDQEQQHHQNESDGTQSSSSSSSENEEKPEFVFVELLDIRKDVQCPICLVFKGKHGNTRKRKKCLYPLLSVQSEKLVGSMAYCHENHQVLLCMKFSNAMQSIIPSVFIQGSKNAQFIPVECIDKSMRMGNNECPACRTHCASRRSLRDDPNYDALIAALYPDIDKYEEEELAFHEEERTRNKQIQASIAQIIQRQSEALVKRRTLGKESTFMTRSQRTHRPISRRRRNSRGSDFQGYEDIEDENDDNIGKDSSSTDDRSTEVRQRRRKRQRASQPSSSAVNSEGGCAENDLDSNRENRGLSPGLVWNTEMLAWGRGGTRSHTRHGNPSGCNNKNSRNTRLSKLVEYLRSLDEKNDELDIHLKLITLDKHSTPTLKQPYLCCRPSLSIKHLCEYVAHQTTLQAEEVEILLVKGKHQSDDTKHPQIPMDELQILKGQETVAGLKASCSSRRDHLILAYRQKEMIKS